MWTTTVRLVKKVSEKRIYAPIHPGRVLDLEFLEPLGITSYKLAVDIGVDPPRVYKIVKGERGITADTALRLSRYFGNSPEFWIHLQTRYDLEMVKHEAGDRIEREVRPLTAPTL